LLPSDELAAVEFISPVQTSIYTSVLNLTWTIQPMFFTFTQWPDFPITQWPDDPITQWPNDPITQ